jgi:hypothetical protein
MILFDPIIRNDLVMVRNPRSIGKEMPDRDLAAVRLRVIRQIIANVFVEVEPSLLNQLEREDRRKSFGDRTYLEPGLFSVRDDGGFSVSEEGSDFGALHATYKIMRKAIYTAIWLPFAIL